MAAGFSYTQATEPKTSPMLWRVMTPVAAEQIKIGFRQTAQPPGTTDHILVVSCQGHYPPGCRGDTTALALKQALEDAVRQTSPRAVILDLSELDYVWGDDLAKCFPDGITIVTGPKCHPAVVSLLEDSGCECPDQIMCCDLTSALRKILIEQTSGSK